MRKPIRQSVITMLALTGALFGLSGCNSFYGHSPMLGNVDPAVRDVAAVEAALDASDVAVTKQVVPAITGVGYATISVQPARNANQKRLMAIRAARLDAMRDLTEQVHGLQMSSRTTIIDTIVQNDTTRASVAGTIRGARTVRINPVGSDTYEVVLELDRDMIARIMKAVR